MCEESVARVRHKKVRKYERQNISVGKNPVFTLINSGTFTNNNLLVMLSEFLLMIPCQADKWLALNYTLRGVNVPLKEKHVDIFKLAPIKTPI